MTLSGGCRVVETGRASGSPPQTRLRTPLSTGSRQPLSRLPIPRLPGSMSKPQSLSRLVLLGAVIALFCALVPPASPASADGAVWPLHPRPAIAHGFDPPATKWGAGHRGVDLRGHVGQVVRAALGGRISFAGPIAGKGVVVVDHGGQRTTYEPVAASVRVGQTVSTGQPIGRLVLAQSHCFPQACLHWGLLRGRTYLNPLTLVGAGPVRLLPLTGAVPSTVGAGARAMPVGVLAGMQLGAAHW